MQLACLHFRPLEPSFLLASLFSNIYLHLLLFLLLLLPPLLYASIYFLSFIPYFYPLLLLLLYLEPLPTPASHNLNIEKINKTVIRVHDLLVPPTTYNRSTLLFSLIFCFPMPSRHPLPRRPALFLSLPPYTLVHNYNCQWPPERPNHRPTNRAAYLLPPTALFNIGIFFSFLFYIFCTYFSFY